MTFPRLLSLFLLLACVPGCAPLEPVNGCTIAAANEREVLRARAYLHPAIPGRILVIGFPGRTMGHAALVYRLDPEGWFVYDDTCGTRRVCINDAHAAFPPALAVAREAFPAWTIRSARYLDDERSPR